MARILKLDNRSVIKLTGPDSRTLLQGLITNDINKLSDTAALYAGLLTPQGKFMFDMIITLEGNDLLLDVEAARKPDLMRRLMMYKLRADAEIMDDKRSVWALFNGTPDCGVSYNDPRHPDLQTRIISDTCPKADAELMSMKEYEVTRIKCGVPDGSRDMAVEKYFWLETNAETLNGVAFDKGCYVGQELTARMKHRTSVKKKLVTIKALDGTLKQGQAVSNENDRKIGEVHTTTGDYALAYLRLEHVTPKLVTETATLKLEKN